MYIYKITLLTTHQVYIGLDTKPSYKLSRWKEHLKNVSNGKISKLYNAIRLYGPDQCLVEVLENNFTSIIDLALAEIQYIKKYDSYKKGLNSTTGGDGLSVCLHKLDSSEIQQIKSALGNSLKDYNNNIKWASTTLNERKELTKHLHTEEVYKRKSETLKKYYEFNPEEKKKRRVSLESWQLLNYEKFKENNIKNGLLGTAKVSIAILVEFPDGTMLEYRSKSEFNRKTGQWAKTVIEKTAKGKSHNGYKAWEIKNE
jgi:hypothetical protein